MKLTVKQKLNVLFYQTFGLSDLQTIGPSDYWTFGLLDLRTIGPLDYRDFGLSDRHCQCDVTQWLLGKVGCKLRR